MELVNYTSLNLLFGQVLLLLPCRFHLHLEIAWGNSSGSVIFESSLFIMMAGQLTFNTWRKHLFTKNCNFCLFLSLLAKYSPGRTDWKNLKFKQGVSDWIHSFKYWRSGWDFELQNLYLKYIKRKLNIFPHKKQNHFLLQDHSRMARMNLGC